MRGNAMSRLLKLGGAMLLLSLPLSQAFAVTVTSLSPAWQLLPNSIGPNTGTWGLPANLGSIGCGFENFNTCEPTGIFVFDQAITNEKGFFTITDPNGLLSDVITVKNGKGGGMIEFFSDPNLPKDFMGFGKNLGVLCQEKNPPAGNGCVGTFKLTTTDGTLITIAAASDVEVVFDPFGFHFDNSDEIKFTGVTPIPEPATAVLLGSGLIGLLVRKYRKA